VLLFWARCRPLFHSLSPDLGWGAYAKGGFDRIVVRCNHDNILSPPHVGVIAATLDQALNAWRTTPTDEESAARRRN
jgi:thioesterase domain-containing protein